MKKIVPIALASLIAVAAIVPVIAADSSKQKELAELWQKMFDLRKQMVTTNVEAGNITKAQGDYMLERMEQAQKFRSENGIAPGTGPMGLGRGRRRGFAEGKGCGFGSGFGMRGGMFNQWNAPGQTK